MLALRDTTTEVNAMSAPLLRPRGTAHAAAPPPRRRSPAHRFPAASAVFLAVFLVGMSLVATGNAAQHASVAAQVVLTATATATPAAAATLTAYPGTATAIAATQTAYPGAATAVAATQTAFPAATATAIAATRTAFATAAAAATQTATTYAATATALAGCPTCSDPTPVPPPPPLPTPPLLLPTPPAPLPTPPSFPPLPTVDPALPDLTIASLRVELQTGASCAYTSTQLGTAVVVANAGGAISGPFHVEVNGALQPVGGLAAGGSASLWFPGTSGGAGFVAVTVDVLDEVTEGNELNNTLVAQVPIPTLPPTCTPTGTPAPTSTATATPTETGTPTPTPTPTRAATATSTAPWATGFLKSNACDAQHPGEGRDEPGHLNPRCVTATATATATPTPDQAAAATQTALAMQQTAAAATQTAAAAATQTAIWVQTLPH